ncbi:hypothetical protein [Sphingomonas sp.]|jgi:hypothetical protein|uniref:hypothetical protein n=1 Tax=Sphingomonas sp. TaxID=28214 RepID=UPI002E31AB08|nr:hypothetical protein [Sphingomonas sp.]HEX4694372.1 hypothetical protein [Sphingomonas sp.]
MRETVRQPLPEGALYAAAEFAEKLDRLGELELGQWRATVARGRDSLWLLIERDAGGYALRLAHAPGGVEPHDVTIGPDAAIIRCASAIGEQEANVQILSRDGGLVRATATLTPDRPLTIRHRPRDLYALGRDRDPLAARGWVEAAQRGVNAGIVFLGRDDGLGSALYFQDFGLLNRYFRQTGTTPDGVVGGHWPELGLELPIAPHFGEGDKPLAAGERVTLSDAYLSLTDRTLDDARDSARTFLDLLAGIYPHLTRPATVYRDWPGMARRTIRDLSRSPKVAVRHYGHTYLRPYVDAEVPDSMCQLAVLNPLDVFARKTGAGRKLATRLAGGVDRFFDPRLGIVRRYLPNVVEESRKLGNEKDENEVDSWYIYHPLVSLGHLAQRGDAKARELFEDSLDFAVKVARRFDYRWPVLFDIRTLKVKKRHRKDGEPGQSDVGGIYASVMLLAYDLTGRRLYLNEAARAVRAMRSMRFELAYQLNLTAYGVNACLRLWQETGDRYFLDESLVFAASFFHNTIFWEPAIGAAEHYSCFLGASALHDGPYMALFECFESFAAMGNYLLGGREDLPQSARMLIAEYCRYTLFRAWGYYPSELPADLLPDQVRNGEIDRKLAIPLEDLYGNGDAPGQVGQEVYGAGAAPTFAARAWHRLRKLGVTVFCEYPLIDVEDGADEASFTVAGAAGMTCALRILDGRDRRKWRLVSVAGNATVLTPDDQPGLAAEVPAETRMTLRRA